MVVHSWRHSFVVVHRLGHRDTDIEQATFRVQLMVHDRTMVDKSSTCAECLCHRHDASCSRWGPQHAVGNSRRCSTPFKRHSSRLRRSLNRWMHNAKCKCSSHSDVGVSCLQGRSVYANLCTSWRPRPVARLEIACKRQI